MKFSKSIVAVAAACSLTHAVNVENMQTLEGKDEYNYSAPLEVVDAISLRLPNWQGMSNAAYYCE